ncbi:MAG: hypothetical protein HKN82_15290 [Akkermansiaceae bacterium]|nr:hypothetical protein [Akkermansiaceae bacterium]NNM29102.1 hypothetical protein [Akkermansiaceae bacterium]
MKFPAIISLLLLTALLPVRADTIILKDGTKYEGKILSEDETSYEMQVQITASIKDVKRIPKADVETARKSTPDDKAFEAISKILPVPDRQSVTRYDELIKGQVQPFLKAHPTSKHKLKAQNILATLEKERARVAAGDLKLGGEWVSAEERLKNLYEIDAGIAFGAMETAAEAGNFKEALRAFEKIESTFAATSYYERAVELAGKVLRSYAPVVAASLARVDSELARRKMELERLPAAQRKAAMDEIESNDAAYLALVEREKSELKTRWLTLDTYQKAPLQVVQNNIKSVLANLEKIDFEEQVDGGPIYEKAWSAASSGDAERTKELIAELKDAKVPAEYVAKIEARLAEVEAANAAAAEEAEAAKKAALAAEAEKMAAEAAEKAAAQAAAGETTDETEDPETADDGGTPATADAAETASSGGLNIKAVLIGVMVVVLLIALGAMLLGKKKSDS